jgi:F-type H+-transporting ATPase subunit a
VKKLNFSEKLIEELNSKVLYNFHFFGLTIPLKESAVMTWVVMAIIMILTLVFVRNLKVVPGKSQVVVETIYNFINNLIVDILGEHGKRYVPYLGTVLIYLVISNTIGLFGVKPPTKDLDVTAGLAIMSIILVEYSGLHKNGVKGYIKSYAHPMPVMAPFNILEIFIRPLSLSMRLFGNIFGGFVIMEMLKLVAPAIIPIPFSLYFDIFDGVLQAYVFVFLTSLFMNEKMEA